MGVPCKSRKGKLLPKLVWKKTQYQVCQAWQTTGESFRGMKPFVFKIKYYTS